MSFADRLIAWAQRRAPDVVIGGHADPYLRRWWLLPRNPVFNVYVHQFLRSDDDRALHDHPWLFSASRILRGGYREMTFLRDYWFTKAHSEETVTADRAAGSWRVFWGKAPHRVELHQDPFAETHHPLSCWTLFITGPRVRQWGFYCPRGWVHWKRFTAADDPGAIGPGCDA